MSWLNTTNQDHLHWKLFIIPYCFISQILLYWYMGMEMYMCMYPSPRISDWCDYKHIYVNIWTPGLLTKYIYEYIHNSKKLTTVFMYKSTSRLRGALALRLISIVLLYAVLCVYVCVVLFCIVSWLNMFLALYKHLEPWTLYFHGRSTFLRFGCLNVLGPISSDDFHSHFQHEKSFILS